MIKEMIEREVQAHQQTANSLLEQNAEAIAKACELAIEILQKGKKVLLFGNGGSAADAQHIAAELTGRFVTERRPLPGIALTTDTSALTAIANDYGYEQVFERQVKALAASGDLLIGISTSGNSPNVLNALKAGQEVGCHSITLTGKDGGKMAATGTVNIVIDAQSTARIQEMHILIGHIICQAIDESIGV